MLLLDLFQKQGEICFKYRGQLPVFLFLLVIPFILFTDYTLISSIIYNLSITIGVIMIILGLLIRFYTIATTPKGTSGRNRKAQVADSLNTKGIYSILRNPLYLGNYMIWLGISITTINIYFVVFMTLIFIFFYERVIFVEEIFLKNKFKDSYLHWSSNTPVIIPSFSNYSRSEVSFSFLSILRREYATVASTAIGFIYVELIRNFTISNEIILNNTTFNTVIIIFIVVIILSLLKKFTTILNEQNRS